MNHADLLHDKFMAELSRVAASIPKNKLAALKLAASESITSRDMDEAFEVCDELEYRHELDCATLRSQALELYVEFGER